MATDSGLHCALLNIRSEEALQDSPAVGAVWESFVFAQLRHRARRARRTGSLFFWRDRTREVDFVDEAAGGAALLEAKWTEVPSDSDAVNLRFARQALGAERVTGGGIVCRARNGFPLSDGFRAIPVEELV